MEAGSDMSTYRVTMQHGTNRAGINQLEEVTSIHQGSADAQPRPASGFPSLFMFKS